jgi:lycopene cyclase domain-containing protein
VHVTHPAGATERPDVDYWLFDLLVLGVPIALLVGRTRPSAALLRATGALAVVALLWTAPWDEHLVRTGVWSYGPDRVLATIGSVPAEEYAFVVLLVALVAAWGHRTGRLPAGPAALSRGSRSTGALCWLAVALAGAGAVAVGGQLRYLGLLLVWVAPPLALQRAVAGDLLRPRLVDRAVLALPVALWLCAADRLALADGIWSIAPASSTGVLLLGLPLEEALFFLVTTLLVTDGLVLATDPRALARAMALARRGLALVRPGTPALPLGAVQRGSRTV